MPIQQFRCSKCGVTYERLHTTTKPFPRTIICHDLECLGVAFKKIGAPAIKANLTPKFYN